MMKKYILSPLCSALIVPGLGQVINGQIKKGLLFLGGIFILLVATVIKLTLVVHRSMAGTVGAGIDLKAITAKMANEDLSLIGILGLCFILVWIYAVIDAFWMGWKIEKEKGLEK